VKIGIAHGNIVSRDAIGTDILGMHDVLAECGFDVTLLAERFDKATEMRARTVLIEEMSAADSPDILIYHHSIYWKRGEALVRNLPARRLLKYHNVTPPEFFEDYSPDITASCAAGRRQTAQLIRLFGEGDQFSADSAYNAAELIDAGAAEASVAPPFTHIGRFLRRPAPKPYPPYEILFVGRMAPHKGHFDLLTVIAAYVAAFGPEIRLTMVGGLDDLLEDYGVQLRQQVARLGIQDQVTILESIDDAALRRLYANASVFLCMSEHEGFCVPVIEAQAAGIPVVSSNATALGETIGPGQFAVDPPRTKADYATIAHLINAVCTDAALRDQVIRTGQRNVLNRFGPPAVADAFMSALVPLLERLV